MAQNTLPFTDLTTYPSGQVPPGITVDGWYFVVFLESVSDVLGGDDGVVVDGDGSGGGFATVVAIRGTRREEGFGNDEGLGDAGA